MSAPRNNPLTVLVLRRQHPVCCQPAAHLKKGLPVSGSISMLQSFTVAPTARATSRRLWYAADNSPSTSVQGPCRKAGHAWTAQNTPGVFRRTYKLWGSIRRLSDYCTISPLLIIQTAVGTRHVPRYPETELTEVPTIVTTPQTQTNCLWKQVPVRTWVHRHHNVPRCQQCCHCDEDALIRHAAQHIARAGAWVMLGHLLHGDS